MGGREAGRGGAEDGKGGNGGGGEGDSIVICANTCFNVVLGKLDLNGKAGFTFTIDELRDLNRQTYLKRFPFFLRSWAALDYKTFRFTVSIPNGASGDVITDATSLKFYSILPLNIRFLPYSRESFKPGLPYEAYVSMRRYERQRETVRETEYMYVCLCVCGGGGGGEKDRH